MKRIRPLDLARRATPFGGGGFLTLRGNTSGHGTIREVVAELCFLSEYIRFPCCSYGSRVARGANDSGFAEAARRLFNVSGDAHKHTLNNHFVLSIVRLVAAAPW